jgi:hypothetical protein
MTDSSFTPLSQDRQVTHDAILERLWKKAVTACHKKKIPTTTVKFPVGVADHQAKP